MKRTIWSFLNGSLIVCAMCDPPDGNFNGYNFWLDKLNQFNGDFLKAEMVKAFLTSSEYRSRFGP
jgi:hypothetical protein